MSSRRGAGSVPVSVRPGRGGIHYEESSIVLTLTALASEAAQRHLRGTVPRPARPARAAQRGVQIPVFGSRCSDGRAGSADRRAGIAGGRSDWRAPVESTSPREALADNQVCDTKLVLHAGEAAPQRLSGDAARAGVLPLQPGARGQPAPAVPRETGARHWQPDYRRAAAGVVLHGRAREGEGSRVGG